MYVHRYLTEECNAVTTGVLHGDVLAPFLFIIMIDYTMRMAEGGHGFTTMPRRSTRHPEEVINDLDFADDIVLLESSLEKAQVQLNTTAEEAKKIGLEINIKKSEFMTNTKCPDNLTLNNEEIKQVKDFTYLGSKMASTDIDVKRRLGLGWATFWKLALRNCGDPSPFQQSLKLTCSKQPAFPFCYIIVRAGH